MVLPLLADHDEGLSERVVSVEKVHERVSVYGENLKVHLSAVADSGEVVAVEGALLAEKASHSVRPADEALIVDYLDGT